MTPTGLALRGKCKRFEDLQQEWRTKAGQLSETAVAWLSLMDCVDPEFMREIENVRRSVST